MISYHCSRAAAVRVRFQNAYSRVVLQRTLRIGILFLIIWNDYFLGSPARIRDSLGIILLKVPDRCGAQKAETVQIGIRMTYLVRIASILCLMQAQTSGFSHDFSIGIIGDTQRFTHAWGGRTDLENSIPFNALTRWFKNNSDSLKIAFISHMGDVVEESNVPSQWNIAKEAMQSIKDAGVPWGISPGNHDKGSDYLDYNSNFGLSWWRENPWFGEEFPAGKSQNQFQLFSYDTTKFLWIHLENRAPPPIIAWAQSILDKHRDRKTFITTHDYISERGFAPYGDTLWNTLVRKNENIQAVFCGHHHGTSYIMRRNDAGKPVHNILVDYQDETLEDLQGATRWIEINIKENRAYSYTINPSRDNVRITAPLRPDTFIGWAADVATENPLNAHHEQEYTIDSLLRPVATFRDSNIRKEIQGFRPPWDKESLIYNMQGRRLTLSEAATQEVVIYRKRYTKAFLFRIGNGGESIKMGYHPVLVE